MRTQSFMFSKLCNSGWKMGIHADICSKPVPIYLWKSMNLEGKDMKLYSHHQCSRAEEAEDMSKVAEKTDGPRQELSTSFHVVLVGAVGAEKHLCIDFQSDFFLVFRPEESKINLHTFTHFLLYCEVLALLLVAIVTTCISV